MLRASLNSSGVQPRRLALSAPARPVMILRLDSLALKCLDLAQQVEEALFLGHLEVSGQPVSSSAALTWCQGTPY